ncbi:nitroreductase family deazaflavin-dependent oxidoreductase [Streptomyces solincola]|uniref:Nitroreductase family deazaflavin-dependent oxidoreductase n=1 Tax=Streptomyces solincola TaxID=2100817 RepID=A0A2S9Q0P5_9ACTN|nr:nitroreductase/quinone reductase family protein [Streptomyces solincola]PRH80249.1 nitroreductase family deazaflavin-dependent oxidoreductase [Streptomyces solincola]
MTHDVPHDFNASVIAEFRANRGTVGGHFAGARLLLLTTTGARSGRPHTTPLGYYPDGDGRVLVIASAGGSPRHPAWYHNLRATPRVTVESGVFTYQADAAVLTGEERDRAFARAVESDRGWAAYQAGTSRVIPVVALTEAPGPPDFGGLGFAEAFTGIHDGFRRELELIRKEVAEQGTGGLGVQLRINCLTFCGGLHTHHTGEDGMMFPALARQHPHLEPVLDRLGREHERVAALLAELERTVSAEDAEPAAVLREVERLTEELEAHLRYEEEALLPVLGGT